jgi:glycosyltransferase involved in cell wall biosynthesis
LVTVVHPRNLSLSPAENLYRWVRRAGRRIVDRFFPPDIDWQTIDPRVRMRYVPNLKPRYVPDADAVFATAWQTAEFVQNLPPGRGERFYLIQHYETWAGSKELVDATWRAPLHKAVISQWLLETGRGLGCEDVQCVSNGIDHEKFRLLNPISNRAKRVAMMFHPFAWKGSPDGLRALGAVKSQHPGLQAVLFGTPRRSESIPDWIEYYQNPPQRELVRSIYNESSVFVCPSWAEGFGLPPAEAMACGCAVASTDCGGVREFAEHEVTALLSPPRDPEALARNMARLLEDDGLRQRLANAGHERIQNFTWERSTDHLEEFIRKCVARGVAQC